MRPSIFALASHFAFALCALGCDGSTAAPDGSAGRIDAGPDGATQRDDAAVSLDGGPLDGGPSGPWQLEPGHFHPAVMPMEVVYPRPDEETAEHARHRWAHPEVEYRLPGAVVQGGAWPFHYELLEGPPGASIGAQLDHVDDVQVSGPHYGVVRWTPSAADEGRSFTFAVQVTDQEGATIEARWTVTVDASRFLFLSPSGDPSNPGTIDAPMRDVADWYRGDPTDAAFADRLVYFRGGAYTPIGQEGNENLRMEAGVKPMTYMGFPGEEVTIDATRAAWTFWAGTGDIFFAGLRFVGSKVMQPSGDPISNARTISFYGERNHDRVTFFEVTAEDIEPGAVGNDNPAFVWRPSSGTRRGHHWAFVNNTFVAGGPRTSNGPRPVSLSCVSHVVYEGNTIVDWHATGVFGDKASVDHQTQRNNDLWELARTVEGTTYGLGGGMSNSYDPSHVPGYFEVAWNRIRTAGMGTGNALSFGRSAIPDDAARGPVWAYRNSLLGSVTLWASDQYDATLEGNVVQGDIERATGALTEGDNVVFEDLEATVFDDATGALVGDVRADHLGTHGAEVH